MKLCEGTVNEKCKNLKKCNFKIYNELLVVILALNIRHDTDLHVN